MIELAKLTDINGVFDISKCFFDWTKEQLKDCISDKSMIFLIKHQGNETIGFLIAQNLVDSINILLIATKNEFQKLGIASELILELEKISKEQNINKIWLEVKETNTSAVKFYENQNFKYLTKRKRYYKEGEDALIYEKSTF